MFNDKRRRKNRINVNMCKNITSNDNNYNADNDDNNDAKKALKFHNHHH